MTVSLAVQFVNRGVLSDDERRAVEALIKRCSDHDGFDPGLHFDTHLNANRSMPAWRLAWVRAREPGQPSGAPVEPVRILVGAGCIFAPSPQEGELAACVEPVYRRQGIGMNLYDGMLEALGAAGTGSALLVCNAACPAAPTIAARFGATADHAEYRMQLPAEALAAIQPPDIVRLTPVTLSSIEEFVALSSAVFGDGERDWAEFARAVLADPDREQFMVHTADGAVGTIAVGRDAQGFMIFGLGVIPDRRGRGLGGAILDSCLYVLGRRGAAHVALEVDAENEAARALYRSRGFVEQECTDYWRVGVRGDDA